LETSDYPVCRRIVSPDTSWSKVREILAESGGDPAMERGALTRAYALGLPPFLFDLAKIERAVLSAAAEILPRPLSAICVNPSLSLLEVGWKNLAELVDPSAQGVTAPPVPGVERVLVWKVPSTGRVRTLAGREEDLLALKIVLEELEPLEVAREAGVPVGALDRVIDAAVGRGILLRPPSRIRREGEPFPREGWPEEFLVAPVFTLQWHITQECDLFCRHCYDRTRRSPLLPEQGVAILTEMRAFCRERFVGGQVSFTGGNPFLYEHFDLLYRKAAELGLATAILGNPVSRGRLEGILAIQRPVYFQVSLEGLKDHNDAVRGHGYFQAVLEFLDLLRDCGVFSVVMLTLTENNVDQVLPLADLLKDRTNRFAFNRLSTVGQGRNLLPVERKKFDLFLRSYLDETANNPILGRKENLLNIVHHERGEPPFGGCTGFGCGAAFNFLSLLPDGEVHACRKFPSPIGNIGRQSLARIYDSPEAGSYRRGAKSCTGCPIRPVCGGCLAVTYSLGHAVFSDTDPYCSLNKPEPPR
jgi:selenobiotic family peptide radical SAM maturase